MLLYGFERLKTSRRAFEMDGDILVNRFAVGDFCSNRASRVSLKAGVVGSGDFDLEMRDHAVGEERVAFIGRRSLHPGP